MLGVYIKMKWKYHHLSFRNGRVSYRQRNGLTTTLTYIIILGLIRINGRRCTFICISTFQHTKHILSMYVYLYNDDNNCKKSQFSKHNGYKINCENAHQFQLIRGMFRVKVVLLMVQILLWQ